MRRGYATLVALLLAAPAGAAFAQQPALPPAAPLESGNAAVTSPQSRFETVEPLQGRVPRGVVPTVQPYGILPTPPREPVTEPANPATVPATPAERQAVEPPPELPVPPSRRQGARQGTPPAPGTPPVPGGSLVPGTTPSGASNPATQPGTLPGGPVQ